MLAGNPIEMNSKDHDLLVRVDEKLDAQTKILADIVRVLDERGRDITDLKTAKLLHEQETLRQMEAHNELKTEVKIIKTSLEKTNKKVEVIEGSSLVLLAQRYPKLAWAGGITFLIMLNFHDIIVPWVFGLFGYKVP